MEHRIKNVMVFTVSGSDHEYATAVEAGKAELTNFFADKGGWTSMTAEEVAEILLADYATVHQILQHIRDMVVMEQSFREQHG